MGNELLTQVGNVSSATNAQTTFNASANTGFNTSAMTGSLFNSGFNGKDYSNDMMMPDWLKTGNISEEQRASVFGPMYVPAQQQQAQPVQHPQQQVVYPQLQYQQYPQMQNYQPLFNGQQASQPQFTQEQLIQYYNELLAQNSNAPINENGSVQKHSNAGKKLGILAGIGTALSGGIMKLCKGEALKNAFSIKGLAVKLPALAMAGWAIGSLFDAFINKSGNKQAVQQLQQV